MKNGDREFPENSASASGPPDQVTRTPRWSRALKTALFTLVTWLIFLVFLELGVRLFVPAPLRVYHPWLGTHTRPGLEYLHHNPRYPVEFAQLLKYNQHGFRDVEHIPQKEPGTFRIVVLGDSIAEAREVALEEGFCRQLEAILNAALVSPEGQRGKGSTGRSAPITPTDLHFGPSLPGPSDQEHSDAPEHYEVINISTSGAGPLLEYLMFRHMPICQDPDLVLVVSFPNDVADDARFETLIELDSDGLPYRIATSPGMLPIPTAVKEFVRTRSRAWGYLGSRAKILIHQLRGEPPYPGPTSPFDNVLEAIYGHDSPKLQEAWNLVDRNMGLIRQLAQQRGARTGLVAVPLGSQLVTRREWEEGRKLVGLERGSGEEVQAHFAEIASNHNIPFLDLRTAFEETDEGPLYFSLDFHLAPAGHRAAAQAVLQWLIDEQLIPGDL